MSKWIGWLVVALVALAVLGFLIDAARVLAAVAIVGLLVGVGAKFAIGRLGRGRRV